MLKWHFLIFVFLKQRELMLWGKLFFLVTDNVSISYERTKEYYNSTDSSLLKESLDKVFSVTMDNQILVKFFLLEMKFCINGFANWGSDSQIQPISIVGIAQSLCLLLETFASFGHSSCPSPLLVFLLPHLFIVSVWLEKAFDFIKYAWKN